MKIFVGASSYENIPQKYLSDCKNLLEILLKDNDLVFGAYDKGIMGLSYSIAKKNHRSVTGICPEVYRTSLEALDCDKGIVKQSIIESTMEIFKNSDLMILLPGGYGSIFEFFTANYLKICKESTIPIIIYNSCGYYDKLLEFIDSICVNIIRDNEKNQYYVANTVEDVISFIEENVLRKERL